ncbi:MAG TPA: hypothetical protein DCO83_07510 [Mucilaginibacter sp.]|nr:hypothetical protein [Mucilaginibacter sp.]
MIYIQHHKYKETLSKWLLAAILILSFFAVSGSGTQGPANKFTRQTTLLAGKSGRPVKSIAYYRAVRQVYRQQVANCFLVLPALNLIKLHRPTNWHPFKKQCRPEFDPATTILFLSV